MYDHPYLRIIVLLMAFILIGYSIRNYLRSREEDEPCENPDAGKGQFPVLIWTNREGRFVYDLREKEEGNYFFEDLLSNAEWGDDLNEEKLHLELFTKAQWQEAIDKGQTVK